jgi:hypothetical protein
VTKRTTLIARSGEHLAEAGETYWQHLRFAATVGRLMIVAGCACLVHAVLPALCTTTASRTIRHLSRVMEDRAVLHQQPSDPFAPLLLLSIAVAAEPWVAGAQPLFALPLSLLTMALPVAYLLAEQRAPERAAA